MDIQPLLFIIINFYRFTCAVFFSFVLGFSFLNFIRRGNQLIKSTCKISLEVLQMLFERQTCWSSWRKCRSGDHRLLDTFFSKIKYYNINTIAGMILFDTVVVVVGDVVVGCSVCKSQPIHKYCDFFLLCKLNQLPSSGFRTFD